MHHVKQGAQRLGNIQILGESRIKLLPGHLRPVRQNPPLPLQGGDQFLLLPSLEGSGVGRLLLLPSLEGSGVGRLLLLPSLEGSGVGSPPRRHTPQPILKLIQTLKRSPRRLQRIKGEIQRLPVMPRHQHIPGFPSGIPACQHIPQRMEIPERFRHLAPINHQVGTVHPIPDKRFPAGRFALRNFVLMMRENIINTPGMQIKALAKILGRHRRTLDMPPWPAPPPRGIPRHIAILLIPCFPQGEVGNILLLIFIVLNPRPGSQPRHIQMRQFPVGRKTGDAEINRSIVRLVGVPLCQKRLNQGDHFRHMVGRRRIPLCRLNT